MGYRSFTAFLLLALSSGLVQLVSADLEAENIFGADATHVSLYPYQVSIQANNHHLCGGSLIRDDLVLTAAHCSFDNSSSEYFPKDYKVVAGSTDLYLVPNHPAIDVAYIYVHKNYTKTEIDNKLIVLNDIAVWKLKQKFPLGGNNRIGTIDIPKKGATYEGLIGVVTGYGANVAQLNPNPTKKSDIFIFASDYKLYKQEHTILNSNKCNPGAHICGDPLIKQQLTQLKNSLYLVGTCRGDSGGPLAVFPDDESPIVVGIVSYGPVNCDSQGILGHFTEVAYYSDWIINVSKNTTNVDDTVIYDVASFLSK